MTQAADTKGQGWPEESGARNEQQPPNMPRLWFPRDAVSGGTRCILITVLYNERHPERAAEYLSVLDRNLRHPCIERVVIFYEQGENDPVEPPLLRELRSRPVHIEKVSARPTMGQLLRFVSRAYPARRIIMCNADIFFDSSLQLLDHIDMKRKVFCLSRWEAAARPDPTLRRMERSQDAWIFELPIPSFPAEYPLGQRSCDGRFAHDAHAAGLLISDPSLTIRAIHVHASEVRHWLRMPRVRGPRRRLTPVTLPLPVAMAADRHFYLLSELATLEGTAITVEATGGLPNIGQWHGSENHAKWELWISRGGRYDVWVDQSSASSPQQYEADLQGETLKGVTVPTGCWRTYRWVHLGSAALRPAEDAGLELRAAEDGEPLMNCRGIVLVPAERRGNQPTWWFRRAVGDVAAGR